MGLVTGLVAAIIVLVLLLAYLADCVVRLQADVTDEDKADHAKCIAHIAEVTSNRMVAVAVRDLAKRYDSVQGQRELHLSRDRWLEHTGPSIPALWLLSQAERIEAGE